MFAGLILHLRVSYRMLGLELRASCCSLSHIPLIVTPVTVACQPSLSFSVSWSLLKFMLFELVMVSNHLILCRPLLLLFQSFPASGSLPMSQLFASGGQSIGSPSISPSNEYSGLISFRIACWNSLLSKGLSRVFSSTMIQKHRSLGAQPSCWPSSM